MSHVAVRYASFVSGPILLLERIDEASSDRALFVIVDDGKQGVVSIVPVAACAAKQLSREHTDAVFQQMHESRGSQGERSSTFDAGYMSRIPVGDAARSEGS